MSLEVQSEKTVNFNFAKSLENSKPARHSSACNKIINIAAVIFSVLLGLAFTGCFAAFCLLGASELIISATVIGIVGISVMSLWSLSSEKSVVRYLRNSRPVQYVIRHERPFLAQPKEVYVAPSHSTNYNPKLIPSAVAGRSNEPRVAVGERR